VPFSHLAQDVLDRNPGVLEDYRGGRRSPGPEFLLLRACRHPRERPLDKESGQVFAIDLRKHGVQAGDPAVRDELFRSVQDIIPTVRGKDS